METYTFAEMRELLGGHDPKAPDWASVTPFAVAAGAGEVAARRGALAAVPTIAGMPASTYHMVHALDPIVNMMQGLAAPVTLLMLLGGFLLVTTGNRKKGLEVCKWAAVGFLGMQFAPAIMAMLVSVGHSMTAGY